MGWAVLYCYTLFLVTKSRPLFLLGDHGGSEIKDARSAEAKMTFCVRVYIYLSKVPAASWFNSAPPWTTLWCLLTVSCPCPLDWIFIWRVTRHFLVVHLMPIWQSKNAFLISCHWSIKATRATKLVDLQILYHCDYISPPPIFPSKYVACNLLRRTFLTADICTDIVSYRYCHYCQLVAGNVFFYYYFNMPPSPAIIILFAFIAVILNYSFFK